VAQLDQGGTEHLRDYLRERPGTRLVVIDTLKKIRPRVGGKRSVYDLDYEALEPLVSLAAEHKVTILVVHHLRKLDAGDPLDTVSGSTGLTGSVDGAMVLKRDRGKQDATLVVDGRDIEEPAELALRWDADIASWVLMGGAEECRVCEERTVVLAALCKAGVPLAPKEIAERVGKKDGAIRKLLHCMRDDGQVKQHGAHPRFEYTPADHGNGGNDKGDENIAQISGVRRNGTNVTHVTVGARGGNNHALAVSGTARAEGDNAVGTLLRDPPPWLVEALSQCWRDPDRELNWTSADVAEMVLGSRRRWQEALPYVRAHVEAGTPEDPDPRRRGADCGEEGGGFLVIGAGKPGLVRLLRGEPDPEPEGGRGGVPRAGDAGRARGRR
jgi:AAA domain